MKYGKFINAKKNKFTAKIFGCKIRCFKITKLIENRGLKKIFCKSPNVGIFDQPLNSRGSRVTVVLVTSTAQSQAVMDSSVYFFNDSS